MHLLRVLTKTMEAAFGGWMPGVLTALSGWLLSSAFPAIEWSWVAWMVFSVPLMVLSRVTTGEAFRLGLVFGLAHYVSLLYWIVPFLIQFAGLGPVLAVPVLILFSLVLALYPGAVFCMVARCRFSPALTLIGAFPVFWVATEFARTYLLSGFPWALLGYSQYRNLAIIQSADIAGVYGLSFLLAMGNGAAALAIMALYGYRWRGERISLRKAAAAICVWGLVFGLYYGYGTMRLEGQAPPVHIARIGVVQGNVDQSLKWDPDQQLQTTEKYLRLSRSLMERNPDLIVWPETAAPFYFPYEEPLSRLIFEAAKETGIAFIVGAPSVWPDGSKAAYYNSAFWVDKDGAIAARYDKVHLVPFGEYVPAWMPFVQKIVAEVGDFQTGEPGRLLSGEGLRIGALICYEGIFPYLARKMAASGANLLVNMTNDAWYGRSSAPYQHFSHAVFRAVENRRALVRAANTGISGYIDPNGRILETTAWFTDAALVRSVALRDTETFYTQYGDFFAWMCLVASVGMALWPPLETIIRRR